MGPTPNRRPRRLAPRGHGPRRTLPAPPRSPPTRDDLRARTPNLPPLTRQLISYCLGNSLSLSLIVILPRSGRTCFCFYSVEATQPEPHPRLLRYGWECKMPISHLRDDNLVGGGW